MPPPLRFQIVVVLYNSAKWIGPCLRAIERSTYPHKRTIVVDNASSDDAAAIVERDFPWAYLIRSGFNRGFAGGNNFGADRGPRGDLLLMLNPDTEIDPDCLARLAEAFEENPRLGVAGCKIYGPDRRTLQHAGGMIRPNGLSYHLGDGEVDQGQYRGLIPCDYAQGAAMAVRREVWDALGGLDEGFFPAYFEEADFCRRALDAGWQTATDCDATLVHHQDPGEQVASTRFLEMLFRGRARYLTKHYKPWDWIARYLPAEARWLASRHSKGYRRIALRTLWEVWTGTPPTSSPPGHH